MNQIFVKLPAMKKIFLAGILILVPTIFFNESLVFALECNIGIHDPSTIIFCDGKFYTYGTGGTSLISDDGWTWRRGNPLPRRGLAPDVIHIGDKYFLYIAANTGPTKADINLLINKTLDPNSPNYKWEEGGVVASSDGVEDCNAIDPGIFLDSNTKRLWLTYGSYFGYIRLVELDPKTGKRLNMNVKPRNVAINSEASIMIYHDGWYYLLVTHGSCCRGADSGYNIRAGRSKKVTGPFIDNMGVDMLQGGGKLFVGSSGRVIGPGHFGLFDLRDGVQRFSLHYEADLDRGGASVLDIRPLLWKDGWLVAGENLKEGTYQIESLRTGTSLELAVEGFPVGGRPVRRGPPPSVSDTTGTPANNAIPPGGGIFAGIGKPIPSQDVAEVSKQWTMGNIDIRMSNYMLQAQQKWKIEPAGNAGGYLGAPYFKITIAGTNRTLAATTGGELVALPEFTGSPEQLWRFDQLADGSWRIMPKAIPGSNQPLVLSAVGSSFATLAKFDPLSEKQRWLIKMP
ncbi:MAG TPA: family 43 glycosylhydrolase [Pyrinomonadaceae bacterium]|nr:family 43 glycosylhydrolase [Pyrinomonadaceae bacterium]